MGVLGVPCAPHMPELMGRAPTCESALDQYVWSLPVFTEKQKLCSFFSSDLTRCQFGVITKSISCVALLTNKVFPSYSPLPCRFNNVSEYVLTCKNAMF